MPTLLKQLALLTRDMLRPHAGWYALIAALLLTWLGISAIDTVSPAHAAVQSGRWLPVALGCMFLVMLPSPRWIGHMAYPLMGLSVLLLIFLIAPGVPNSIVPVRNGSRAWIDLKFMSFQPSEMGKVAFVLALGWYLRFRDNHRSLLGLLIPFAFMFVPVVLILKEPDLGSALLFAPTLFVMLIAAGAKLRHLSAILGITLAIIGTVSAITIYAPDQFQVLKGHQQDRIKAMYFDIIGDDRMSQNEGYQAMVAQRMAASGGLMGNGKEKAATLIDYNDLPFDYNDMIFPVIVNRWGALGGIGVMGLYGVLVGSMLLVAARSKDPLARLSCVGFGGMIFTQATINIAMTVGLLPITGITLPLISYGGTSMLFTYIMVGLTINFAARRPQMLARPSFEFDNADAIFQ